MEKISHTLNELSDVDVMIYSFKRKKKSPKKKKYILDVLQSFFEEEIEKYNDLKERRAACYDSAKGYLTEARRAFAFAEKERIMKEREQSLDWLDNALYMLQEAEHQRDEGRKLTKLIKRRYSNG